MTAVQQMRSFERPTERDHQSVFNYMWNTKPIVEREASWVQMKEDLVALRPPKEPDWLEARIGGAIVFLGWRFLQVSKTCTVECPGTNTLVSDSLQTR